MFLWNGLLKGTNGMLWSVKYNSKSNNVWFISRWCFSLLFLACFATNISLTIFRSLASFATTSSTAVMHEKYAWFSFKYSFSTCLFSTKCFLPDFHSSYQTHTLYILYLHMQVETVKVLFALKFCKFLYFLIILQYVLTYKKYIAFVIF